MALHSVYGASAPPGTYSWYTDGTPSIRTAAGFYRSASGTAVAKVAGARLWVTAGCLAANSSATVRLYTTGTDMSLGAAQTALVGTPVATLTLPITATGWNEALFASSVTAAVGQKFYIEISYDGIAAGYQHSGSLSGTGAPGDGSTSTAATGGWGFVLAPSSEFRSLYRIGTGTPAEPLNAALYGIDILMDDSTVTDTTPPSVPTGLATGTITHNTAVLNWTASTDDVGVVGYEVFLGGVSQGTPTSNTFTITGLSPSTSYSATVRARDSAGNWSSQSSALGFSTNAAPATGGKWINHVTIRGGQNGTNSHTVSPSSGTVMAGSLFTPTAGNRLLCIVSGAVTSTTPAGWTLPSGASSVGSTGLYAFHKVAAGSDTVTTTHNASNYEVIYDFYEFYAGTTFVGIGANQASVSTGVAAPNLTGLTGTNLVMHVADRGVSATTGSGAFTWSTGTEVVDVFTLRPSGTIDGVQLSVAYLEDYTGSSSSAGATWTGGLAGSAAEKLAFALNVTQPPTGTTGTLSASIPKTTGAVTGAFVTTGTLSASLPKVTANVPQAPPQLPARWAAYDFEEGSGSTVVDKSGNGRDLTISVDQSWVTGHGGGLALRLPANQQATRSLSVPGGFTALTIEGWVRLDTVTNGQTQLFAGFFNGGFGSSTRMAAWVQRGDFSTPNVLQGNYRDGAGLQVISGTRPAAATWTHIALSWDGANIALYLDGVLQQTVAFASGATWADISDFGISSSGDSPMQWDDLRVFAVGLTGAQVVQAMNTKVGAEGVVPVTGTVAGTLPKLTANAFQQTTGTVSGTLPKITGSITGTNTGTVAGTLPKITGQFLTAPTIAQENAKTDNLYDKSFWYSYGDDTIQGFARSSYYLPGQTAEFSINYNSTYDVHMYRLGAYPSATDAARRVATFAGTPVAQPAAVAITGGNGAVTCSAWSRNVTWAIPADATPGWYVAFLRETAGTAFGHILFCVSDKQAKKPILVVSSDATWGAAYNGYGGNNVYGASIGIGSITGRAYCSTYDKPVTSRFNVPQTHFYNGEMATLRFFERFGFEVGYTTCEQINNDPTIMDGRELVVFSGHNEYISTRIWDKTAAVLAAGTNILNLSGNDFFWRVAYGDESGFPTGATDTSTGRVMWCRKDTMTGPTGSGHTAGTPFSTQADWTGTWQDTRYTNRRPSTDLLGDRFIANGIRADEVKVPYAMKDLPVWRNCAAITGLTTGQTFSFGVGTAGMEWDFPDGNLPSVSLSASTVDLTSNSSDVNGENYNQSGTYTHAFQIVRNGPGYIINGNTTQWGWALDNFHLRGTAVATDTARQATLNMLYDLGGTGVSALITGAGLTAPTPVSNLDTAYGLPQAISGSINGTLPAATGSVAGILLTGGVLSASLPKITAASSGASLTPGTVAGALPVVTGALSGTSLTPGTVAAVLPGLTGSIDGASLNPGIVVAALPMVAGAVPGGVVITGAINGTLPAPTALITGAEGVGGAVQGTLPRLAGSITGDLLPGGGIDASLPRLTATIVDTIFASYDARLPKVRGSVTGTSLLTGTVLGILPKIMGAPPPVVPPGDEIPPTIVITRHRGRLRGMLWRPTRYRRDTT